MHFYQFYFSFIVLCTSLKPGETLTCPPKNVCKCVIGETNGIFCPSLNNLSITVIVHLSEHSKNVQIHCSQYSANVYNELAEWDVGDAHFVEFNQCALINGTTMRNIFDRLKIRKFRSLKVISSSIDEMNDNQQFLTEHLFDDLPSINQIHQIWYEYTNVFKVHENVFTKTTNLKHLSLAHNAIVELPPTVFDKQINLQTLDLSFNRLTILDDSIFESMSNLTCLYLSHNQLTKISR